MKILVVGSGGREDALAWRLSREATVAVCPGNAGTRRWGENISGSPEAAAKYFQPDLVVIGPETALAEGLADRLRSDGFVVFGPGRNEARIETSKTYGKQLMERLGIPTARVLPEPENYPVVVKKDGLAGGKGVRIARSAAEAVCDVDCFLEEFLDGDEVSVFAVTDGRKFHLLPSAEDYKPLCDGDAGPNTGGMGAVSPAIVMTPDLEAKVIERVIEPLMGEIGEYRGLIYAGLMIVEGEPWVLEFNARFGDPETQVILPRVSGNFGAALLSVANGELNAHELQFSNEPMACVVLASGGYPGPFETGFAISGDPLSRDHVFVGGAEERGGSLVTSGGRVLSLVGPSLEEVYSMTERITFRNCHFRRDIGARQGRMRRTSSLVP